MKRFPTEPEVLYHGDGRYRLWQNEHRWWVAEAAGQEFHGATRADVEPLAIQALEQELDNEQPHPIR